MARRRGRRKSALDSPVVPLMLLAFVVLAVIFAVLSFLAENPWVVVILVLTVGTAAYWRWWRIPHRRAEAEQASREQADRDEYERQEAARRDLRDRSLSIGGLLTLSAREFEVRVGEILGEHGYDHIEHVGRAGDLGIDLFATDPSGERVGVQCKRYSPDKRVRAPEVRLLYGDMTHAKVRGLFVTTSGFTADAAAYAESHGIVIIDGARLAKLVAAAVPEAASDPT